MRIRIVSYTAKGRDTAERAAFACEAEGHDVQRYALKKFCRAGDTPLSEGVCEWAGSAFVDADALIFCCASGIAVRAIAPWVRDKTEDPAVLVIDERASFVIPILSGHIGGANALAEKLAFRLGSQAVLTTATDVNGLFAVDVFAERNHLAIEDMQLCKAVSAALLAGEPVGFRSELPIEGPLPEGLTEEDVRIGILVGTGAEDPYPETLRLIPRRYAAGVGCRRNKPFEELNAFFEAQLREAGISVRELLCVASIDLKQDEAGLIELCRTHSVLFRTFSARELNGVPGEFSCSDFVLGQTGVDCVCERAAVLASGGKLVQYKVSENGMTFALAKTEEAIRFV